MMCALFGVWCAAVGHWPSPPEARVLCPQPDITAYQLGLLLTHQGTKPEILYTEHPDLLRHTSEQGKCKS